MKVLKIANNMFEILEENKVIIRHSRLSEQDEELLQALIDSEQYEVQTFDIDVVMPEHSNDWTISLI